MIILNDREVNALRKVLNHYYFICREFDFGKSLNPTLDRLLMKLDVYYIRKSFEKESLHEKENS